MNAYRLFLAVMAIMIFSKPASATPMKEFVMSCTYGVLAGTLVGAASLAFTKQPGENLSRVARGASLGLYAGITLGLYIVYGVSDEEENPDGVYLRRMDQQRWVLLPSINERGYVDGAGIQMNIVRF